MTEQHTGALIVAIPAVTDPVWTLAAESESPHVTLCWFGESDTLPAQTLDQIMSHVQKMASLIDPFEAHVSGTAFLGDNHASVLLLESQDLVDIVNMAGSEQAVLDGLANTEQYPATVYHLTLNYDGYTPQPVPESVKIAALALWIGDERYEFALNGVDEGAGEKYLASKDDEEHPVDLIKDDLYDEFGVIVVAAGSKTFDPGLHPRGADGRFIRKFGIVKWLENGKWQYGRVDGINSTGDGKDDVEITVTPSDLGGTSPKNAVSVALKPSQIYVAPKKKAHLPASQGTKVGNQAGSNPGGLYEIPTPAKSGKAGELGAQPGDYISTDGGKTWNQVQNIAPGTGMLQTTSDIGPGGLIPPLTPVMLLTKEQTGGDWPKSGGGGKFYVKKAKSSAHGRNEALANALYQAAGVAVPDVDYNEADGQIYSGIVEGKQDLTAQLSAGNKDHLEQIQRNFAVDAWLGNWDVFGLSHDNVLTDAHGTVWRIDNGGALLFRAQGAKKGDQFGNKVTELEDFRHHQPKIYGKNSKMSLASELDGAQRVLAISPGEIQDMVADHNLPASLADTLIARREFIAKHYGLDLPETQKPQDAAPDVPTLAPIIDPADVVDGKGKRRTWFPVPAGATPLLLASGDHIELANGDRIIVGQDEDGQMLSKAGTANQLLGVVLANQGQDLMVRPAGVTGQRPEHGSELSGTALIGPAWQRGDRITNGVSGETYDVLWAASNGGMLLRGQGDPAPMPFILDVFETETPFTVTRWDPPAPMETVPAAKIKVKVTAKPAEKAFEPPAPEAPASVPIKVAPKAAVPAFKKPEQTLSGPALEKVEAESGSNATATAKVELGDKESLLSDGTVAKPGDIITHKNGKKFKYVKGKGPYVVVTDPDSDDPTKELTKNASVMSQPGLTPAIVVEDTKLAPKSANGMVPQVGQTATAKDGHTGTITMVSPDGKFVFILDANGVKKRKSIGSVTILGDAPEAKDDSVPEVSEWAAEAPQIPAATIPEAPAPDLPAVAEINEVDLNEAIKISNLQLKPGDKISYAGVEWYEVVSDDGVTLALKAPSGEVIHKKKANLKAKYLVDIADPAPAPADSAKDAEVAQALTIKDATSSGPKTQLSKLGLAAGDVITFDGKSAFHVVSVTDSKIKVENKDFPLAGVVELNLNDPQLEGSKLNFGEVEPLTMSSTTALWMNQGDVISGPDGLQMTVISPVTGSGPSQSMVVKAQNGSIFAVYPASMAGGQYTTVLNGKPVAVNLTPEEQAEANKVQHATMINKSSLATKSPGGKHSTVLEALLQGIDPTTVGKLGYDKDSNTFYDLSNGQAKKWANGEWWDDEILAPSMETVIANPAYNFEPTGKKFLFNDNTTGKIKVFHQDTDGQWHLDGSPEAGTYTGLDLKVLFSATDEDLTAPPGAPKYSGKTWNSPADPTGSIYTFYQTQSGYWVSEDDDSKLISPSEMIDNWAMDDDWATEVGDPDAKEFTHVNDQGVETTFVLVNSSGEWVDKATMDEAAGYTTADMVALFNMPKVQAAKADAATGADTPSFDGYTPKPGETVLAFSSTVGTTHWVHGTDGNWQAISKILGAPSSSGVTISDSEMDVFIASTTGHVTVTKVHDGGKAETEAAPEANPYDLGYGMTAEPGETIIKLTDPDGDELIVVNTPTGSYMVGPEGQEAMPYEMDEEAINSYTENDWTVTYTQVPEVDAVAPVDISTPPAGTNSDPIPYEGQANLPAKYPLAPGQLVMVATWGDDTYPLKHVQDPDNGKWYAIESAGGAKGYKLKEITNFEATMATFMEEPGSTQTFFQVPDPEATPAPEGAPVQTNAPEVPTTVPTPGTTEPVAVGGYTPNDGDVVISMTSKVSDKVTYWVKPAGQVEWQKLELGKPNPNLTSEDAAIKHYLAEGSAAVEFGQMPAGDQTTGVTKGAGTKGPVAIHVTKGASNLKTVDGDLLYADKPGVADFIAESLNSLGEIPEGHTLWKSKSGAIYLASNTGQLSAVPDIGPITITLDEIKTGGAKEIDLAPLIKAGGNAPVNVKAAPEPETPTWPSMDSLTTGAGDPVPLKAKLKLLKYQQNGPALQPGQEFYVTPLGTMMMTTADGKVFGINEAGEAVSQPSITKSDLAGQFPSLKLISGFGTGSAPAAPTPKVDAPNAPAAPEIEKVGYPGQYKPSKAALDAWDGDLTKDGHIPAVGMMVMRGKMTGKIISISKDGKTVTVLTSDGKKSTRQVVGLSIDKFATHATYVPKPVPKDVPAGMPLAVLPMQEAIDATLADGKFRPLLAGQPGVRYGEMLVTRAQTPKGKRVSRVHFHLTKEHRQILKDLLATGGSTPEAPEPIELGDWVTKTLLSHEVTPGMQLSMYVSSIPNPDKTPQWKPKAGVMPPTHTITETELQADGTLKVTLKDNTTGELITSIFQPNRQLNTYTWDENKPKPPKPKPTVVSPLKLSDESKALGWTITDPSSDGIISATMGGAVDGTLDIEPGQVVPINKSAIAGKSGNAGYKTGGFRRVTPDGIVIEVSSVDNEDNSLKGQVVITMPEGATAEQLNSALASMGLAHQPMTREAARAKVRPLLRTLVQADQVGNIHSDSQLNDIDTTQGLTDEEMFDRVRATAGLPVGEPVTWDDVLIGVDESTGKVSYFWSPRVREALVKKTQLSVIYRASSDASVAGVVANALYGTANANLKRTTGMIHTPTDHNANGFSPSDDAQGNGGHGGFHSAHSANTMPSGSNAQAGYAGSAMMVYLRPEAVLGRIADTRASSHSDAFGKPAHGSNNLATMLGGNVKDMATNGGIPVEGIGMIAVANASVRETAIKKLKSLGHDTINGIPVEDFIVPMSTMKGKKPDSTLPPVLYPSNIRPINDLPETYDAPSGDTPAGPAPTVASAQEIAA